jgi:hypothetical protein
VAVRHSVLCCIRHMMRPHVIHQVVIASVHLVVAGTGFAVSPPQFHLESVELPLSLLLSRSRRRRRKGGG